MDQTEHLLNNLLQTIAPLLGRLSKPHLILLSMRLRGIPADEIEKRRVELGVLKDSNERNLRSFFDQIHPGLLFSLVPEMNPCGENGLFEMSKHDELRATKAYQSLIEQVDNEIQLKSKQSRRFA